ncbi:MAG: 30S ribosomal protein S3 [Alphaproteobacteria bacterium]|nr:30S ribosomal protein S3 [Alphaproteobacteria bacterium]
MGQKVNPIGLRLNINRTWESNWYANKNFGKFLHEDLKIKSHIAKKVKEAGLSKVFIERSSSKKMVINIHVARPGVIVNKKKNEVETLRRELATLVDSDIRLNIIEVRKPEIDAQLVASNVATQLEKRISFRRAMKKAVQNALKSGASGIRINCSGRLGGAEIARMEWYREGRVPLHTLRADIDYGEATGFTTYGACGIKVWIFKGEVLNKDYLFDKSNNNRKQSL